ncbi:hypothetical protein FBEOM_5257 [Fusarium beomiforme]|uniref:Uncharacterized protein n=1 Tax=Fusarium beomiforme TaxID=44412 RepID=A0A9P5AL91_9HYPO|nr:hypothetical protein FBEOM_5257 [Fusarium beomiforme]
MSRSEYVELDSFENLGKEVEPWSGLPSSSSAAQGVRVELTDTDNHVRPESDSHHLLPATSEERKTEKALSSKLSALGHFALFHLPALTGTLTLLSLYIAKIRWHNPPIDALNALQFTAKAHEALLLISLGDILLHRIAHGLLHQNRGTPIGFLSSAFYLGSPFQYLVSPQLWTPIMQPSHNVRYHRITGAIITFVVLLSISASPLSAVAMIPRQRWWNNPDVYLERGVRVMQLNSSLYTTNLTAQYFMTPEEEWRPMFWSQPSQEAILQSLGAVTVYDLDANANFPWTNLTYNNYPTEYQYRPISLRSWGNAVITTCAMKDITEFLGTVWKAWNDPSEEWLVSAEHEPVDSNRKKGKQPLVSVECSDSYLKEGIATFEFGTLEKKKTISLNTSEYPVLNDALKKVNSSPGPIKNYFLNLRDSINLPISSDILFVSSFNETQLNDYGKKPPVASLNLCLISATWTEADNWIEFSKSNDKSYGTDNFISIETDWMRSISTLPNRLSNRTSYEEIARHCIGREAYYDICLQLTLSLHITDAISQIGRYLKSNYNYAEQLDPRKDVIRLGTYIYTYGYDFYGSRGIPLAFSVMLLHVVIVFVHLTMVLLSKHPWQGVGCDNFGDMLILALYSKAPSENGRTGEKAESSDIWTESAVIATGKGGRSQLALRDENAYGKP